VPEVLERMEKAYAGMSKGQRKIVHFLKAHPSDLAFDSLAAFSEKSGSSEATVVRFAHCLGYRGFTDMQREMQRALLKRTEPEAPRPAAPYRFRAEAACAAIHEVYAGLDREAFEKSCTLLMQAERVLIIGYMDAFGVAAQALHALDTIRPHVEFSRLLFETNGVFRHLHPGTAVLVVSFEPHYKFSYEMMEMANAKKCPIVLLSDSTLNPMALLADYVLCAEPVRGRGADLMDVSAPIHLLSMMAQHMADTWPGEVERHRASSLRRFEEYLE
jgi:DNA-binding MurR/RpiR family transcriptional regulator